MTPAIPMNMEAEGGVLGSMLLDPDCVDDVAPLVRPEDFMRAANEVLCREIYAMRAAGLPIDPLTVCDRLELAGTLTAAGGENYVADVIHGVPHAGNARYYAQIVREKAVARQVIRACQESLDDAHSNRFTGAQLSEALQARAADVADHGVRAELVYPPDLVAAFARNAAGRASGLPAGLLSGLHDLDRLTDGFQPGQLVVLAGRPSMGKSLFALNLAEQVAVVPGPGRNRPVLFSSIEMGAGEIAERMHCSLGRVSNEDLRTPARASAPAVVAGLARAGRSILASGFVADTAMSQTVEYVAAAARRLSRTAPVAMVVVDYLQLMAPADPRLPRQEQVASISRGLKGLAKNLSVPVVVLSQLNRQVESREDHRPRMADLRESGAVEADADLVVLVHRPSYYDPNDSPGLVELIVAKNRNGPTGTAKGVWNPQFFRIDNLPPAGGAAPAGGPGPDDDAPTLDDFGPAPKPAY